MKQNLSLKRKQTFMNTLMQYVQILMQFFFFIYAMQLFLLWENGMQPFKRYTTFDKKP
jgi:hypothetical protein